MIFTPLDLDGLVLIEPERRGDDRGFFARTFCTEEFAKAGLVTQFPQANASHNPTAGTLRGMHYQVAPHEEVKVVRCTKGAIFDVAVDLRPSSPTYKRWQGVRLDAEGGQQLYVPAGFGHGYQTLEDGAEVSYLVSHPYTPGAEEGFRHDDPSFGIAWPHEITLMSEKDRAWPDWR